MLGMKNPKQCQYVWHAYVQQDCEPWTRHSSCNSEEEECLRAVHEAHEKIKRPYNLRGSIS